MSKRKYNPVSPYARIKACYGFEYIKQRFSEKLAESKVCEVKILVSDLSHIGVSDLVHRSGQLHSLPEYVSTTCRVLPSSTPGYPSIKFRLDTRENMTKLEETFTGDQNQTGFSQESVPLDLHRLAALSNAGWDEKLILNGDLVAIHRCHNSMCFNPDHVYFDFTEVNKSTDYCPSWTVINGVLVDLCTTHNPKCLVPSKRRIPNSRFSSPTTT